MVLTRKGMPSQSITFQKWDEATYTIIYGGAIGQFSKYIAAVKPTATQINTARNEVWKTAGLLA